MNLNEQLNKMKSFMGLSEQDYTIPGKSVWNHIVSITPNENDIPWGFQKQITSRNFKPVHNFNLTTLLKTDPDFKDYYESGDERYDQFDDINPNDLNHEIVVVDGQLLDGYSRAATLLRKNKQTTNAFVAI